MLDHTVGGFFGPYHTMPCHIISYHTISYHTMVGSHPIYGTVCIELATDPPHHRPEDKRFQSGAGGKGAQPWPIPCHVRCDMSALGVCGGEGGGRRAYGDTYVLNILTDTVPCVLRWVDSTSFRWHRAYACWCEHIWIYWPISCQVRCAEWGAPCLCVEINTRTIWYLKRASLPLAFSPWGKRVERVQVVHPVFPHRMLFYHSPHAESVLQQLQWATLIYLLGCQISLRIPEVFRYPILFVKSQVFLEKLGTNLATQ